MRKIVVGIDLSSSSERALAHAIDLARHRDSEVVMVLVDVIPEQPERLDASMRDVADRYNRLLGERLAADRRALGEMRERWIGHGAQVSQLVVDGHPDEALTTVGEKLDADLVVVGSHGRSGLQRWLLGSVAEHVVRFADRSVLVARGTAPSGGYRRVVVGTDFSPGAEQATTRVMSLLAPGAHVELVHGWNGSWMLGDAAAVTAFADLRAGAEVALTEAALRLTARLRDAGRTDLEVQGCLREQPAAIALAEVAAERGADLVVVGSHGRRGVRRLLLGSVAEAIVRHAPCAVLVAR
jgi:nucleotide-binding universal stress UspA family protein